MAAVGLWPPQSTVVSSSFQCVYHVQRKARHGSHWHPGYRAADLKPYVRCAESWLKANDGHPIVFATWQELNVKLAMAGPVDPAMNLSGRSAAYKAQTAFARLRDAGISPDRLIAIYLATAALIEDDKGSHRVPEFRIVQAAKAVHRLASGTHRSWNIETPDGRMVPYALHAYPKIVGISPAAHWGGAGESLRWDSIVCHLRHHRRQKEALWPASVTPAGLATCNNSVAQEAGSEMSGDHSNGWSRAAVRISTC